MARSLIVGHSVDVWRIVVFAITPVLSAISRPCSDGVRQFIHTEAIHGTGLQICAEGEQTTLTILHYKLARVPRHVCETPSELHASRCVLSVKSVRIFDEQVGVEQFVRIFIGIGCGRLGAAEMNRVLVARNDGVDWRILPRAPTFEAKLVLVIGESGGNVRSEELRGDLTDHEPSLVQVHAGG